MSDSIWISGEARTALDCGRPLSFCALVARDVLAAAVVLAGSLMPPSLAVRWTPPRQGDTLGSPVTDVWPGRTESDPTWTRKRRRCAETTNKTTAT